MRAAPENAIAAACVFFRKLSAPEKPYGGTGLCGYSQSNFGGAFSPKMEDRKGKGRTGIIPVRPL